MNADQEKEEELLSFLEKLPLEEIKLKYPFLFKTSQIILLKQGGLESANPHA